MSAMSLSGIFARLIALIGAAAILWRRLEGGALEPAFDSTPAIPPVKPQVSIPTLDLPTARGRTQGQTPVAAPGLKSMRHDETRPAVGVSPNRITLLCDANGDG